MLPQLVQLGAAKSADVASLVRVVAQYILISILHLNPFFLLVLTGFT